jgi:cytochrome c oxidase subunit 4
MSDDKKKKEEREVNPEPVADEKTHGSTHPPYFAVFVILAVLTVVEIYASGIDLPQADIIAILMVFATAKAMLVALYYMHLKYESYALKMIAFVPLVIAVMFALVLLV